MRDVKVCPSEALRKPAFPGLGGGFVFLARAESRVCRGGEEQELGDGQPPAGDPGAAEASAAAASSAGVRPGGRALPCACAAASPATPAFFGELSSAGVKVSLEAFIP